MPSRIIVCGLNSIGYRILCLLRRQNAEVVGIHDSPIIDEPSLVVGDPKSLDVLERANLQNAHTLVITYPDDSLNLDILMQARLLNPRLRIISRLFNENLGDRLDHTLPEHTSMSVASIAAPIFAFAGMGNRAIGQLRLFQQTWPIYEEYIHTQHPWYNKLLNEIWDNRSQMLIAYLTSDREISLVEAMNLKRRLQEGDRLIVGTQPTIRNSQASWLKQGRHMLESLRRFPHQSQSTLITFLVLLLTILLATSIYTDFGWAKTSPIDALYFSVGMITGAGGNEGVAEHASPSVKLFTVVMMLVGAGVIGISYALLNDLVLGSRLRQVWDVARVPQRDHYIICGLGSLGIRIAAHLQGQGHEIVAIEQDGSSRFLSMARSQQIPVILGDATLSATLKMAHLAQAAALLAVASDDMTNLEIALTAKDLAPKLPIVVRSQHPEKAQRMQQVFDFEAVLSPPELAAPVFAAAALGGKVFGSGLIGDSLWIGLSLLVTPAHPFCGKSVETVAIAADLVPLYLETTHQSIHGVQLLKAHLHPNDVLHLTIPATNLERLWRTTAVVMS